MAYSRPGVYITEGAFSTAANAGSATVAAGFVGTSLRGPVTPTKVSSWVDYKNLFGEISNAYDLPYAVYHFFANGGRDAYISRVYNATTTTAASAAGVNVTFSIDSSTVTAFRVSAENKGAWGNGLTVSITAGLVTGSTPTFVLTVKNAGAEVERWGELSLDPNSNRYVATVVNNYSTYLRVSSVATYSSVYVATVVSNSALSGGSDGSALNVSETNAEWNAAVARFVRVDEELVINMVNMTTTSVVNTAITYCENAGNRFLVIDPVTVTAGADAVTGTSGYSTSSYAAVYYPKLIMVDPSKSGSAAMRTTAPGGAILGLYSRVEAERTVAKAAAGFAYDLRGALGLETSFTEVEQGTLYDAHINTLKAIPGAGVIVYGARTLKKTDITKYIPVRRSLNYVKSQAKLLTAFAVFEPNNDGLWGSINTRLGKFLSSFWSSGGLKGRTSAEAYYIICNRTNNTSQTIENGEVRIEIGVALQTPAEFIIINVSQFTGGAQFNESV